MTDARTLTQDLGGKWYRSYGAAPCPVCQPSRRMGQNALTLADGHNGHLVLHCKKTDCAFLDILAAVGLRSGDYAPPDVATLAQRKHDQKANAEKRAAQAYRLWDEAQPIIGTAAETYLRWRGISCDLPPTLRFHKECWHAATAKRYPALVAAVQGSSLPAVHRTYLRPDGLGKADIEPAKAMLGTVAGGVVRLCEWPGPLVVGEGIESTLSLLSGLLDGPVTAWAALSTSGLRGLRLPPQPGRLIIATDGDAPGRAAGHALADRAHALGWQVSLLPAPDGRDWNDILTMKGEIA
ncbi:toprim domain-containing protein [Tritonibacter mobilis]|uniref:DUF7146 domain-containing protein n=1 Tax=Tritonibacter mobilis TaxID=379347 RepID=UPI001401CF62|nr:toprim domain-containing protein [Tritonibacter mobilis]NHM17655.1 hypothetical protein [Tritonibacter mobilis]NHM21841.1 hypothetical protein [Tritonibacter mobilis]